MLSRFRQPTADFRVELSETTLKPDDDLKVRVSLIPRDGFQVRSGRVEILCVENFVERVDNVRTSQYGSGTRTIKLTNILDRYEQVFLEDSRMRRGLPRDFDVDWTAPADAAPTAVGVDVGAADVGITWVVRTSLDVAGARDFNDVREVKVVTSPVNGSGASAPIAAQETHDQCALTLTLLTGVARSGETIAGTLRAEILQDMSLSEVRAELIRMEAFGYSGEEYYVDTASLETDLDLRRSESREWRFELKAGQVDAPSLQTNNCSVRWMVKCVLARRLRFDTSIEQEIWVGV